VELIMSRGLGKLQRALFWTIRWHGKPMTFDDIRAAAIGDGGFLLAVSIERSLRRALHRMVSDGFLIAIGGGGRGDPFRYFFHPMGIALMCGKPEAKALWKALQADPGAEEALVRLRMREEAAPRAQDEVAL
jgi:hypothetical protein